MSANPLKPPAQPEFGAPLPVRASQELIDILALRRSAPAPTLAAPGPSPEVLDDILRIAARAPDHGKLNPWRFIVIEGEAKAKLVEDFRALAAEEADPVKAEAALGKVIAPPLAVVVVSAPTPGKIPEWEQKLSAGAVCTLLLLAAQGFGFGAHWITDWYAFSQKAAARIGVRPGEASAGYIYIGTPSEAPLERARPDMSAVVSRL
jgi:nitroreductase